MVCREGVDLFFDCLILRWDACLVVLEIDVGQVDV